MSDLDLECINTMRFLSVDMVERAKSGHPGLPLGAAPMAYVLWTRFLRHDPARPDWPDRDRFLLSAGHGCALLYALLHLTGYDLGLEELQRFRQWGSRTPGHPESELTTGVEATTGPLGQGFAMGVGLAIAERLLAETYNRDETRVVDHWTYGLVSDGDLMEGISSEAASLAGTMGLGKLLYLYDDNHVSLEGGTELAFTEDVEARFRSYGWHVNRVTDGNDLAAIEAAIRDARSQARRPSLVIVRTHIGYGSPRQDTKEAHGEPLGPDGTAATKRTLGWPLEPPFLIPDAVRTEFRKSVDRGREWRVQWEEKFRGFSERHAELAQQWRSVMRGEYGGSWEGKLPRFSSADGPIATRDASAKLLGVLAPQLPSLIGGSGDLAPSTKTLMAGAGDMGIGGGSGRNIHFGVREHAMMAIVNGMARHGGVLPFGATFLIFSDYARAAIRLGALMQAHALYVFTHDSVGLGEDGPTHQPVEQLWGLRSIPGLTVLRPADANESVAAWSIAIRRAGPVALVFTRQKLPVLDPDQFPTATGVPRGGYTLWEDGAGRLSLVLLATGSEVHLALDSARQLAAQGVRVRVVSVPSVELFEEQDRAYRESVLPPGVPRVAVEAGSPIGWWKYVGPDGDVIGIRRFGASAPGPIVLANLGFSVDNVVRRALAVLHRPVPPPAS